MIKSVLFWLPTILLLTIGPVTNAQQTEKIFRIGFLDGGTAAGSAVLVSWRFCKSWASSGHLEGGERLDRSSTRNSDGLASYGRIRRPHGPRDEAKASRPVCWGEEQINAYIENRRPAL